MAFGTLDKTGEGEPMAEINMIPLIDVMLVLLVVFMITAPLLTHAVKIDLPKASSTPAAIQPDTIELAIRAGGELYWNGERVDSGALQARLSRTATLTREASLHIRADRTTPYDRIARVMSAAAKAGVTKIGFITEPVKEQ